MKQETEIDVMIADASHEIYVDKILTTIEEAAKVRGTGIAKRTHEYVAQKMKEGKAVIALAGDQFAGFSYIESWGNKQYVTTSGLIGFPRFGYCQTDQGYDVSTGSHALAESEGIQSYFGCSGDEDEHRTRLCTCNLFRSDRRRIVLARLHRLRKP